MKLEENLIDFRWRIQILGDEALKKKVLEEAHSSRYIIHPESMEMYRDLRKYFLWRNMKRDIAHKSPPV